MGRRYSIAFDLNNMVPAPAGVAIPKTIFKSEDGILVAYGTSVPSSVAGYAKSCIFLDTSAAKSYTNTGDADSCTFTSNT